MVAGCDIVVFLPFMGLGDNGVASVWSHQRGFENRFHGILSLLAAVRIARAFAQICESWVGYVHPHIGIIMTVNFLKLFVSFDDIRRQAFERRNLPRVSAATPHNAHACRKTSVHTIAL